MPILPAPRTPTVLNSMLRSSSSLGVISSLLTPMSGRHRRGFSWCLSRRRIQFGRKQRNRRALEQADNRQGMAQLLLDHSNHLDGSERRPACLEEVFVHPDARPAQHLFPYARKRRFRRAAGRYVGTGSKWLLAEPVFLDRLRKSLDVAQILRNLLQALRLLRDTECQSGARRWFFTVHGRRLLALHRRALVWTVFHICQPIRRKDPGSTGFAPVAIANTRHEFQCRQVLRRRHIGEFNKSSIFLDRHLSEPRHNRTLHSPAQDSATQQERVDLVSVSLFLIHQDADKSIVTESIGHADRETAGVLTIHKCPDLFFRAPNGCEVELIGSNRQL